MQNAMNQNQTSASEMHHDKLTQSNDRMDEDENKLLTQITQLDSKRKVVALFTLIIFIFIFLLLLNAKNFTIINTMIVFVGIIQINLLVNKLFRIEILPI